MRLLLLPLPVLLLGTPLMLYSTVAATLLLLLLLPAYTSAAASLVTCYGCCLFAAAPAAAASVTANAAVKIISLCDGWPGVCPVVCLCDCDVTVVCQPPAVAYHTTADRTKHYTHRIRHSPRWRIFVPLPQKQEIYFS